MEFEKEFISIKELRCVRCGGMFDKAKIVTFVGYSKISNDDRHQPIAANICERCLKNEMKLSIIFDANDLSVHVNLLPFEPRNIQ